MHRLQPLLFAFLLLLAGCDSFPPPPSIASTAAVTAALDREVLTLDRPPPGSLPDGALVLEPERTFGDPQIEFGRIKDVAADANHRMFVADDVSREIHVLRESGEPAATIGGAGEGPGELHSPGMLVITGPYLVVGQPRRQASIVVFDMRTFEEVGRFHFGTGTDWGRWTSRHPLLNADGDQQGSEDASWRIEVASDTSVLLLLRPNDLRADGTTVPVAHQTASLVELHLPDGPADTLRTLAGTLVRELQSVPGVPPRFGEDMYAARPIVAAGDDWLAWTHGDSASVEILGSPELGLRRIEWPTVPSEISDELKRIGARWDLAGHMLNSTYSRNLAESMSTEEIERGIRMHAFDLLPFPRTPPSVTAMTGYRRCLFLAGFQPIDNSFGISSTWTVVDTGTGELERVLRFAPPADAATHMNVRGAHVRAIRPPYAYAVYRSTLGLSRIARYELPELECAEPG